jgi:hypothetical protein
VGGIGHEDLIRVAFPPEGTPSRLSFGTDPAEVFPIKEIMELEIALSHPMEWVILEESEVEISTGMFVY